MNLGNFELEKRVAEGGMGVVWKGRHLGTGEQAAVKILKSDHTRGDKFLALMRQEVQATARFDHPNIVSIYDYGLVPETDQESGLRAGEPYYAMEFVAGPRIAEVVRDFESFRALMTGCLEGLAHAHSRGVIHRDIKPENIMCERRPGGALRVVITDFGIAHALEKSLPTWSDAPSGKEVEMASGTPAYMAPEQAQGMFRDYGPWTDLYALGLVAWELICDRRPYASSNVMGLLYKQVNETLPQLTPRFAVPERLTNWIDKMTAKQPWERFRTAAEALRSLKALRLEDDVTLSEALPDRGAGSSTSSNVNTGLRTSPSWTPAGHRLRSVWVPSGVGLLGLRTIPFIGREFEREQLWQAFQAVVEERHARIVMIRGVSGTGKSRLASWLGETVVEQGLAITLRASHQPQATDLDGLSGMLAIHHRCVGLSAEGVVERTRTVLQRRGIDSEFEVTALATLMYGAGSESLRDSNLSLTLDERVEVVRRSLERLAGDGPVVVWLDDVQWGREAIELLGGARDWKVPVLIVATVLDEAIDDSGHGARLREIQSHEETTMVEVEFFDAAQTLRFVREGLSVTGRVADVLKNRCGGSPLFATQMICHWVETEQVARRDGVIGFTVDEPTVPKGLTSLWEDRLSTVLESEASHIQIDDTASARARLEAAAALGVEVLEDEWREFCDSQEIPEVPGLLDALAEAQLVVRRDRAFSFVHSLMRDAIAGRARLENRWARINLSAAYFLMKRYRSDHPALSKRAASMFSQAGAHELAVAALWSAFQRGVDLVDPSVIGDLGETLLELMDRMGLESSSSKYFQTQFWLGVRLVMQSARDEVERGHALMAESLEAARSYGEPDELAVMLSAYGWSHLQIGEIQRGLELAADAVGLAESKTARSQVYRGMAFMLGADSQHEEAVRWGAQAVAHSERPIDEIRARTSLGHSQLHLDLFDEGRLHLETAANLAREAGLLSRASAVLNSLGDLELKAGEYQAAHDAYAESLDIKQALLPDTAYAHATKAKLGRTKFLNGDYHVALELLMEVKNAGLRGENIFFAHPSDAILACAAAMSDWRIYEEVFEDAFDFEYPGWIHARTLAKGRTFLDQEHERRERFDAAFARFFG